MRKEYVLAVMLGLIPATGWADEGQKEGDVIPTMEEVITSLLPQ